MYAVSAGFKTNIKAASRIIGAKVVIGSNTYFTDNIADMTYEATTNPSGFFELGSTASAQIELTLINVTETFETALIQPYLGVDVSGTIEYVPLGKFYADVADRRKNQVRLVLFDAMTKLDTLYISSLTYPTTITAVLNEICTQTGITFSGAALPAYTVGKLNEYTRREVLGFIAQLAAGFARFKLDGTLTIQGYSSTSSETITSDSYIDYNKTKDTLYRVDTVSAVISETQVVKGTLTAGGSNLALDSNPWMTDTFLTDIYNKIKTFSFLPLFVDMQGNPSLECGDLITLTTVDAGNITVPIMRHKITFFGGMRSELESEGESPNVNQQDTSGSMTKKIDRSFANLDADNIVTGRLKAQFVEIGSTTTFLSGYDPTKIQIGGVNLYLDSFLVRVVAYLNSTLTRTESDLSVGSETNLIKIVPVVTTTPYMGFKQDVGDQGIKFELNKKYTLTFKARGNVTNFSYTYFMRASAEGSNISTGTNPVTLDTTNWTTVTIYKDGPFDTATGFVLIGSTDVAVGKYFEVKEVKLEQGSLGSDFSYAPEDLMQDIDTKLGNITEAYTTAIGTSETDITLEVSKTLYGDPAVPGDAGLKGEMINYTDSKITQTSDAVNLKFTSIDTTTGEHGDQLAEIYSYFDFSAAGLNIGKSDSPLQINISNSEMDFIDNGNIVAYVNGQKMYINTAEVLESIIVGNHKIEKYDTNITLVKWVGV